MTLPPTPPSETTCVLSPQLVALGSALAPVADAARRALARRVRPSGEEFETLDDLAHHLGVVGRALLRLTPRLDGLMADVIRNDVAGPLEVGRSAGRLEQVLSELFDGYLEAKASRAGAESSEARALILGVYRHHIRNICAWLDDLVATIMNPAIALQRQGIEPADHVELKVALNMTIPPEMARLEALVKQRLAHSLDCEEPTHSPHRVRDDAPGLLGTIGALVFGLGVSSAVFGRKHE